MDKKIIATIALSLTAITSLFLAVPRLSTFSAVDEPYWTYERTPDFWRAIQEKKWKRTKINDKPGVTVAILSGFGLPFSKSPLEVENYRKNVKTPEILNTLADINFKLRLPIYLFSLLILPIFFLLTRKLLGTEIALFSSVLIWLSPIILGITLIINPDSLLWIFSSLSILSYLIYFKENERKYLVLSGIFLGFSLLTKYVANILLVYFISLIFLEYIFRKDKKYNFSIFLRREFFNYLIVLGTSVLVFTIFFPATWVNPGLILGGTIGSVAFKKVWPVLLVTFLVITGENILLRGKFSGKLLDFFSKYKKVIFLSVPITFLVFSLFVVLNTYLGMHWYDFQSILASPKSPEDFSPNLLNVSENFFSGIWALLFGLTPFSFLLVFFQAFRVSSLKKDSPTQKEKTVFYFLFLIMVYYLASALNGVGPTVRYQIVLYPLALLVVGIGLYEITRLKAFEKYLSFNFALPLVFLLSLWSVFLIKPFFLSYASALLPEKYVLNLKDMGDGSFEAATYLNNLPNAQNLIVWSDKGAVCEAFLGKCVVGFERKDFKNYYFDYYVASAGREHRSLGMSSTVSDLANIKKAYETEETAWKLEIGGRKNNFVKITSGNLITLKN
jgi:4-amino-4-deoxy-L-arabinose transferase-like glycosyltransferase